MGCFRGNQELKHTTGMLIVNNIIHHLATFSHFTYVMMTSSNGNIFRVTGPSWIQLLPVNSPHKGQWRVALMIH